MLKKLLCLVGVFSFCVASEPITTDSLFKSK